MNIIARTVRHTRITAHNYQHIPTPKFLVLFINSICNMKCEHCFYWTSLNQKDDLTKEEIFDLSRSLGKLENLNLSGGEPFLRQEFAEICRQFIQHNKVRQIYVPTNGYYTDKTVKAVTSVLEEQELDILAIELSLDGMPEFHDKIRVTKNAFKQAMQTYEALVEVQKRDPRLRIHANSTAMDGNLDQIKQLSTYLYDRCPQMDHHNLAIIRGDRKNPSLALPVLKDYEALYDYIRSLWMPREEERYGSIVEPMLQWTKVKTLEKQQQVAPCTAGRLSAVVYANGDVSACELHSPIGNLRKNSFPEIWESFQAEKLRKSIANKECYCTTEVFLWPSIVYQPVSLAQAMIGAKVWQHPQPLEPDQKLQIGLDQDKMPIAQNSDTSSSVSTQQFSL
ncbi:radical SAM protein (plasmid) [Pseudanabaena biceps]|nr:radical SAM protein [Pseudanabaena biceps]